MENIVFDVDDEIVDLAARMAHAEGVSLEQLAKVALSEYLKILNKGI